MPEVNIFKAGILAEPGFFESGLHSSFFPENSLSVDQEPEAFFKS